MLCENHQGGKKPFVIAFIAPGQKKPKAFCELIGVFCRFLVYLKEIDDPSGAPGACATPKADERKSSQCPLAG
jgi:hypothetical protein